jgi:carbon storage regulator CsrA
MTRLVLTRKTDEEVIISDISGDVLCSVSVSKIDRGNVRLSFEANRDLRIDRKEVFLSKKKNNQLG